MEYEQDGQYAEDEKLDPEEIAAQQAEDEWANNYGLGYGVPEDWRFVTSGNTWSNVLRAVRDSNVAFTPDMVNAALHFPHWIVQHEVGLRFPLDDKQLDFLMTVIGNDDAREVREHQAELRQR